MYSSPKGFNNEFTNIAAVNTFYYCIYHWSINITISKGKQLLHRIKNGFIHRYLSIGYHSIEAFGTATCRSIVEI